MRLTLDKKKLKLMKKSERGGIKREIKENERRK